MQEQELKTSTRQRVFIAVIALIMLGSVIASYVLIVASGSGSSASTTSEITEEKREEYSIAYQEKLTEFQSLTASDFDKFSAQLPVITTYDETAANNSGIQTRDLLTGDGRELTAGDTNYLAFYAGWCADGTIFDSSLNSKTDPTAFSKALNASQGLISGWNTGVIGMRLGGIRELTLSGDNAYGDQMELCGGYSKPLKFLILPVANEDPLMTLSAALDQAYLRVQYANYGIDYDAVLSQ